MIERGHLAIIRELQRHGTLTEAADALCLSQSALSHQIRYLETRLGVKVWRREGRRLHLTRTGELLLQTAEQVLPVIEQAEATVKAWREGRQGVLRVGVECYPCYQWLSGVVGAFMRRLPDVEIDIVNKFQFSGFEGLLHHHIDVLVTPDPVSHKQVIYQPLAEYEMVLVVASKHALAKVDTVQPGHLREQTLLTFPVASGRLDILNRFLLPADVQPRAIKPIESLDLMLQMVSMQRGVCVLPDWLAAQAPRKLKLVRLRLGKAGLHKQLLMALRKQDASIPYIQQFIEIGGEIAQDSFSRNAA